MGIIQNASLGEHKIRDLNDDMNKLLREKYAWEKRILELNGPDYRNRGKMYDRDNAIGVGSGVNRYMYFGAARELDSVRELFKQQMTKLQREKKGGGGAGEAQEQRKLRASLPPSYFYGEWKESDEAQALDEDELDTRELFNVNVSAVSEDNAQQDETEKEEQTIMANMNYITDFSSLVDEEEWRKQVLERKRQLLLQKLQNM